jgi:two-component system OmpR family sensor kinase
MTRSISITRRLIVTVLVLELLSAIALIGAITVHERHVQLKAFDASLLATAEMLMGAVQDAEDEGDNVMLDLREVQLGKNAAFRVEDEQGRLLGSAGEPPRLEMPSPGATALRNADVNGRAYRFLVLHGLRIVDAGEPDGGIRHSIKVVYGTPVGHVWHEVLEAIRFYAIATAILLGVTGAAMVWLVRKGLSPVYELAREAERISSSDWRFDAPVSAKDTIELRPLAVALEDALARLQRSFDQQRRFTNDAAHELKTDVAIVKSSLQLLSMRKRTVNEYCRGLALSLDDFTRLESTVQKMLTLARLEQRAQIDSSCSTLQSCSLRDAIEDAVNQIKPLAELKGIRVEVELAADAKVPIDSRDALLLCSNILLNAVQHGPDDSIVQIATTMNEDTIRLTIQDHGEGISDQDRDYLFEPFYRGDPSRSRRSGGTGLGLSICKAICERAGGAVEIANNAAGGALVTVKLPIEPLAAGAIHSASLKAQ